MSRSTLVALVAALFAGTCLSDGNTFPVGDVRACFSDVSGDVNTYEVLPGSGWDNLRNVESGMVLAVNYSQCRTTDDKKFLIPDYVNVYPVKTSKVDSYAEVIEHWTDYVSATSKGINLGGGFKGVFDISGTFSDDYTDMKKKQIEDDTFVTRVQARYVRYRAVLQPDMPLDPGFKFRLLSIAGSLELGDLRQARFDSQQLVREFGTHVSTSVDAGAAILQEDQISQNFLNTSHITKSGVKAAATFSFATKFGVFNFGPSYASASQKSFNELYVGNRTDSIVKSIGGGVINRTNVSTAEWVKNIDDDLVAIDRAGEPIFSFINAQTLPEIPASTLLQLSNLVQESVMTYYKVNTHPGCTHSTYQTTDDGSCRPPMTNMTFGGVYQVCNSTQHEAGDLCKELSQTNPMTGDYECPIGYEAVSLYSGEKTKEQVEHVCGSCWLIFGHCCHDEVKKSNASYETYWCVASKEEETGSGYMFGGVYTSHIPNPVTSSMTCPNSYMALKMGENIRVCVSDDYLQAVEHSIPFAGFFSCSSGNPLALGSSNSSLSAHMYTQGPQVWPRRCPQGYSRYTTEIMPEDGCEINHCILPGALANVKLPEIRRPPFISASVRTPNAQNMFVFDPAQNVWAKNGQVASKFPDHTPTVWPTSSSQFGGSDIEVEAPRKLHAKKAWGHGHHAKVTSDNQWNGATIISVSTMLVVIGILTVVIIGLVIALARNKMSQHHHHGCSSNGMVGRDNYALSDVATDGKAQKHY